MANKQSIQIEDRSYLKITGVKGVKGLTETDAYVILENESLEIKGSDLKAEKLSVEDGELILVGNIYGLKFAAPKEKKGLLKRIFK